MKFGFIFETEHNVGEDFIATSEVGDVLEKVIGIESTDMGSRAVEILSESGIRNYDFCGAFTEEQLEEYKKIYGEEYKFNLMRYLPEENEKLEKAEDLSNYGVIIRNADIEISQKEKLTCPTCDTTIYFVKDLEKAKEAAKEMVKEGIHFIELCAHFDKAKTEEIIEAIGGVVPIGTAGQL